MRILSDVAKNMRFLIIVIVVAAVFGTAHARAAGRVIGDSDIVTLPGNVHPLARPEFDTGAAPSSLSMGQMILVLRRSADKQAELDRLLAGLQDPTSPDFHQWLTPKEFGDRFGPSAEDIDAITGWLTSHGFVVEAVGNGKSWINFSGTVAEVEAAFHTSIHTYQVKGRLHHANARDPSIPRGLADVVAGIASLNDFRRKPMNIIRPAVQPDYNLGGSHFLSPGDFATIYDINALYSAGINGAGQSIAIVGRTLPATAATDWAAFRTTMGLPANPPQVIEPNGDPGDLGGNEDVEADLDVEWSGAVAPNATILFVTSPSVGSTDGVDLSAQYIVDNKIAPVMSESFGACEADLGRSENRFYDNLWSQAAGEGITAFVSSGDSGAAGCDAADETSATQGLAVNGLASTPYNVAVGGTEFNEGSGTYWSPTNNAYDTSALSYIPEVVWNESGSNGGSDLYATGGGLSTKYSKPSWQVAPGVPSNNSRCVPDVALSSAGHDAYLVEMQGGLIEVYGTSAASPSMAGLMALIVQKTGQSQGNANTRFYQLANAQYGAGGVAVFHDITSGNNSVPGLTGYSAGTGYSCTTGLGSVDAYALVTNWTPGFSIAASPNAFSIDQGSAGPSTIQTNALGDFDSAVALSASGLPAGVTATFNPATIAAPGSGTSTMTITVASSSPAGSYPVTVAGSGGGVNSAVTITLVIVQTYTMTAEESGDGTITDSSGIVASGGSVTFTMTPGAGYTLSGLTDNGTAVNATQGPSGTFTYTIADVTANQTVDATFSPAPAPAPVPAMGSWGFIGAACGLLWLAVRRRRNP